MSRLFCQDGNTRLTPVGPPSTQRQQPRRVVQKVTTAHRKPSGEPWARVPRA